MTLLLTQSTDTRYLYMYSFVTVLDVDHCPNPNPAMFEIVTECLYELPISRDTGLSVLYECIYNLLAWYVTGSGDVLVTCSYIPYIEQS